MSGNSVHSAKLLSDVTMVNPLLLPLLSSDYNQISQYIWLIIEEYVIRPSSDGDLHVPNLKFYGTLKLSSLKPQFVTSTTKQTLSVVKQNVKAPGPLVDI